jgi:hypothetical protein
MQEMVSKRSAWKDIEAEILGEVASSFKTSTVKEIIESNESGRHWTDPAPAVNGHIYGYQPNNGGWLRYGSDAREQRGLSAHQFMSPSEWFAEAYAFYFDGKDSDGKYGAMVGDKDPATKKWLDENIGPTAAPTSPTDKK